MREYDCIDDERETECDICGLHYTQINCGGGGCPRCAENDNDDE
jgi:hypothetical protein